MAEKKCADGNIEQRDLRLNRRDIRDFTGWGNTQLGIHLQRLLEMEYLHISTTQGRKQVFELLYTGEGQQGESFFMNLINTKRLRNDGYDLVCTG